VPVEVVAKERDAPIELAGTDLDGKDLDLADLRGKPVVVNVWWSQCPPCRVEQPDLNEAAADLGTKVTFLGINIRDSSVDSARSYVRGFDVPYPSIYSADGSALLPFAGTLNPRSIPSTVVLDADGRIAASVQGRVPTTQTLLSLVEKVLDE
jgi:thiol-disulfide isomerase/thioredoxin